MSPLFKDREGLLTFLIVLLQETEGVMRVQKLLIPYDEEFSVGLGSFPNGKVHSQQEFLHRARKVRNGNSTNPALRVSGHPVKDVPNLRRINLHILIDLKLEVVDVSGDVEENFAVHFC